MRFRDPDVVNRGANERIAIVISSPAASRSCLGASRTGQAGGHRRELRAGRLRRDFAERDGILVTGKQDFSCQEVATLVIAASGRKGNQA